ncbi:MAG: group II truncated hemoglobin [Bacteroidetes bacterium]|nr:group II truncated hemoglobin [Bacteroidota bacterium]
MKKIPTLYEWAGGLEAFEKLTEQFYKKVLKDPLLEPVFKNMSKQHQLHVAHFIAEVFGGPKIYTEDDNGSHYGMMVRHLNRHLTEEMRRRWMALFLDTADELGIPTDPEFRSALVGYLEWGSRIAVINSQNEKLDVPTHEPMPSWDWGVPKGPYIPDHQ